MTRVVGMLVAGGSAILAGCESLAPPTQTTGLATEVERVKAAEERGQLSAAIQSAREITFSRTRREALVRLAGRPDLGAEDQLGLIDAAVESELFSYDVASVLSALAENPAFTPDARSHMVQRMADVPMFGRDRARLEQAMLGR